MENWDVYDQHRNKTGKIITRGSEMAPDEFHVVVHVCIFNKQGEMLIQQRQPFKDGYQTYGTFHVVVARLLAILANKLLPVSYLKN